jgi:NAD(P)-dependent dehydrogenase (short-subunit alcohol dehydrogenase family)
VVRVSDRPAPEPAPKTALIAGASSGIGAATARLLAADGYAVHLMARREAELRELAEEIGGSYTVVDFADAASAQAALAALEGPVGIALYAAGTLAISPVAEHPLELWERTLAVNLTGAFLFARGVVGHLVPGSSVFFISSFAAGKGQPLQSAYAASKSGLERFAESLGSELEPDGVSVNVIAPGPVATPMLDIPGTSPFQLDVEAVAQMIAHLAALPPDVVVRPIGVRAPIKGPFARKRH